MRIDIEQFLALTMAMGTAGAIGLAIYTAHTDTSAAELVSPDDHEAVAEEMVAKPAPVEAATPVAPAPAAAPKPVAAPAPAAAMPPADEDLDRVPAPQDEGWWMAS